MTARRVPLSPATLTAAASDDGEAVALVVDQTATLSLKEIVGSGGACRRPGTQAPLPVLRALATGIDALASRERGWDLGGQGRAWIALARACGDLRPDLAIDDARATHGDVALVRARALLALSSREAAASRP